MSVLVTLIAFLLILGVLIFVHELGHFAVAKWVGMRVDEFAIGFPPRLRAWKKGETEYALNAIPFGGYVRIHGETGDKEGAPDQRAFDQKSVWARMAVIVAGVTMNVLFAFVLLVVSFSVGFVSISQDLTQVPGAVVQTGAVAIAGVAEESGAAKAGIQEGDILKRLTDPTSKAVTDVSTAEVFRATTKAKQLAGGGALIVDLVREGKEQATTLEINPDVSQPPAGVYLQSYQTTRVPFWQAPGVAVREISAILGLTWDALRGFGEKLFMSAQLDPAVSGPVGIYEATGLATQSGPIAVVFLIVALSLNLALLNILPIPALDGGKLLFLLIEAAIRRPLLQRRLENAITFAGFVLLIGLIIVLSARDLYRLFT
jgi:regulator of sigma E protease